MNIKQIELSNTLIKGRITELNCLTYFLKQGFIISTPQIPCAYDFLLDINGEILKIQVKTCRLSSDKSYIEFNTSSMTHNASGYTKRVYNKNNVDYFATFYDNECYLIPLEECGNRAKRLRLLPTKSGQIKNISFAENYTAKEVLKQYI